MQLNDELQDAVELASSDLAIAGAKLDQLCVLTGGPELARQARREVKKLEYQGMSIIEAIYQTYRLVAANKL